MAMVTGLTAARMLEIEAASIIAARVEDYDLILTTFGGTDINVGDVRGPEGPIPTLASLGIVATPEEINFVDGVTSAIQEQINNRSLLGHDHDDRYFTDSEVMSILDDYSLIGHNHDDRYYTEAEVNNLLAAKAASVHTHDDRYYTEAEVNNLLAAKAASAHTHDDRYYTEAEVNALLAAKAPAIPPYGRLDRSLGLATSGSTWTKTPFTNSFTGGGATIVSNGIKVPSAGTYSVLFTVSWGNTAHRRIAEVYVNGEFADPVPFRVEINATSFMAGGAGGLLQLAANDTVELWYYAAGGTLNNASLSVVKIA